jgi:hypothetical protein
MRLETIQPPKPFQAEYKDSISLYLLQSRFGSIIDKAKVDIGGCASPPPSLIVGSRTGEENGCRSPYGW